MGDFLFGGDLVAYAAALDIPEYSLKRILNENCRVRVGTFIHFVRKGLVSAEWLLCGTGPMMPHTAVDDLSGFSPANTINTRYPVFDVNALRPFKIPELSPPPHEYVPHSNEQSRKAISIARQIFISSTNAKPIVLFLNAPSIAAGIAPIVCEMLQKKYLTGVAFTLAAAELDCQLAGHTDLAAINSLILRGAQSGLGLGETLAAAVSNPETVNKSILAAAYSVGAPVTIHGTLGESPLHFCATKRGAELGAAYGQTMYIDTLVFAEQVKAMAGDQTSLFLNAGSSLPGLPLLSSAMAAAQEGLGLTFNRLKISRLTTREVDSALDVCVSGPYRYLFESILSSCNAIFEGSFDVYTNKDTGEQFVAFEFLNQCAENVRKRAKESGKRKR